MRDGLFTEGEGGAAGEPGENGEAKAKPKIRNPKSEGNSKNETRKGYPAELVNRPFGSAEADLRISDFGLLSGFGFRVLVFQACRSSRAPLRVRGAAACEWPAEELSPFFHLGHSGAVVLMSA